MSFSYVFGVSIFLAGFKCVRPLHPIVLITLYIYIYIYIYIYKYSTYCVENILSKEIAKKL